MQVTHPKLNLMEYRRLFLEDYEVYINIGVHDHEKKAEQRVILNVDLYIPIEINTPKEDRLEEVVDYDFMRETIRLRGWVQKYWKFITYWPIPQRNHFSGARANHDIINIMHCQAQ